MSTISIFDLRSTGAELFDDSESYFKELSSEELGLTGGLPSTNLCVATLVVTGVSLIAGIGYGIYEGYQQAAREAQGH